MGEEGDYGKNCLAIFSSYVVKPPASGVHNICGEVFSLARLQKVGSLSSAKDPLKCEMFRSLFRTSEISKGAKFLMGFSGKRVFIWDLTELDRPGSDSINDRTSLEVRFADILDILEVKKGIIAISKNNDSGSLELWDIRKALETTKNIAPSIIYRLENATYRPLHFIKLLDDGRGASLYEDGFVKVWDPTGFKTDWRFHDYHTKYEANVNNAIASFSWETRKIVVCGTYEHDEGADERNPIIAVDTLKHKHLFSIGRTEGVETDSCSCIATGTINDKNYIAAGITSLGPNLKRVSRIKIFSEEGEFVQELGREEEELLYYKFLFFGKGELISGDSRGRVDRWENMKPVQFARTDASKFS